MATLWKMAEYITVKKKIKFLTDMHLVKSSKYEDASEE
jgi:hypothetical protein